MPDGGLEGRRGKGWRGDWVVENYLSRGEVTCGGDEPKKWFEGCARREGGGEFV